MSGYVLSLAMYLIYRTIGMVISWLYVHNLWDINIVCCLWLPAGQYCGVDGLSVPTGDCTAGWYCANGAYSDMPVEFDSATADFTINITCPGYLTNNTGGPCTAGRHTAIDLFWLINVWTDGLQRALESMLCQTLHVRLASNTQTIKSSDWLIWCYAL